MASKWWPRQAADGNAASVLSGERPLGTVVREVNGGSPSFTAWLHTPDGRGLEFVGSASSDLEGRALVEAFHRPHPSPVPVSGVPSGYVAVAMPEDAPAFAREAWLGPAGVVITGVVDEDDEDHNCDAMGCGWDHVLEIRR